MSTIQPTLPKLIAQNTAPDTPNFTQSIQTAPQFTDKQKTEMGTLARDLLDNSFDVRGVRGKTLEATGYKLADQLAAQYPNMNMQDINAAVAPELGKILNSLEGNTEKQLAYFAFARGYFLEAGAIQSKRDANKNR
jgi:hypothetical protein